MNKTFTWRLLTPGELTDVYLQEMRRDFPAGELKPLSMILTSEAEGLAHTWGVFDGETLAAYLLMVRPEGSAISQLDYFAVVPAYRAGGLGAKLLAALQDAPAQYSVITQLALLTGARRGEICALRWSDIDLDAGVISINRTVQNIAGRGTVFTAPKTKRSRRCIKIGPECVQLLREYRQHQKAERFKVGSEWVRRVEIENGKTVDNDLLFTRWNGQPFDPNAVTSWFPGFLAAHDLPAVHFHSLRHTNASLLIAAHVPVTTVSGRLGHAKTSTTTDIYAGFIRSSDAAAADALTDVFSRIKEKTHA